jgi:hypothetical protein
MKGINSDLPENKICYNIINCLHWINFKSNNKSNLSDLCILQICPKNCNSPSIGVVSASASVGMSLGSCSRRLLPAYGNRKM